MIDFCKLANDVLGNKVNRYIISGKTANFNAKILNLVIFFRSSEFYCESGDFSLEACGSTGFWFRTGVPKLSLAIYLSAFR